MTCGFGAPMLWPMPVPRFDLIADRRAIIDRRALSDPLAALPADGLLPAATALLGEALAAGRAEVARRLEEAPSRGRSAAAATAFLHDQIAAAGLRPGHQRLYPNPNPTVSERIALVALGGSGRGEMAPYSDVDLMLLVSDRRAPWCEQVAEALLYLLWDLKLKIGQSLRTIDEVIAPVARRHDDPHRDARSALDLGRRGVGERGDAAVSAARSSPAARAIMSPPSSPNATSATARWATAATSSNPTSRTARAACATSTRSTGSANMRSASSAPPTSSTRACSPPPSSAASSAPSASSGRCAAISTSPPGGPRSGSASTCSARSPSAMRYADRPGKSAVERFMQFYFLNAKVVGDLTGLFLAQLDEQLAEKDRRFALPRIKRRPGRLDGFALDRGRLTIPRDDWFCEEPARLVELFALAARDGLEIHPAAMRAAARDARRVDERARRPRRQRLLPRRADRPAASRRRAAVDERGRGVRALRSRLRPRRGADAVRHVPPLHRRRAQHPRDRADRGDRARRAGRRPSAGDRLVQADRVAAHALRRGAAPRHRQGPRRRP